MTEHKEIADAWVDAWVDKHVKTRILDGRPHRTMIAQLKADIADLLASQSCVPPTEPAKRGRPRKDAH